MELARESLIPTTSTHCIEWPKTPQANIGKAEKRENTEGEHCLQNGTAGQQPTRKTNGSANHESGVEVAKPEAAKQEVEPSCLAIGASLALESHRKHNDFHPGIELGGKSKTLDKKGSSIRENPGAATKPQISFSEQPTNVHPNRFLNPNQLMARLKLKAPPWPNPELSLGAKCNPLGGNECWVAIGPAQELFTEVDKKIAKILDTRVNELEEGEPVAGNILTFGMYMLGSRSTSARPTIIFSCQSVNLRKRAIKFVKQSGILKGHPKVLLAQNSISPLASGRGQLQLLALSTAEIGVIAVSVPLGVFALLSVWVFNFWRRRKRAHQRPSFSVIPPPPRPMNQQWGSNSPLTPYNFQLTNDVSTRLVNKTPPETHPMVHMAPITTTPFYTTLENSLRPTSTNLPRSSIISSNSYPELAMEATYQQTIIESGSAYASTDSNRNPGNESPLPLALGPPLHEPHRRHSAQSPAKLFSVQATKEPQKISEQLFPTEVLPANTSKAQLKRDKHNSYLSSSKHGCCGIPIMFSEHTRATIGGFIQSKGESFGLTVSHIMQPVFVTSDTCGSPEDVDDFAFDVESEEEFETDSTEYADIDITTQASISSVSSPLRYISTNSTSSQSETARDSKKPVLVGRPEISQSDNKDYISVNASQITASSILGGDLGLDWALVRLTDIVLSEYSKQTPRLVTSVKPTGENRVTVARGWSGVANGSISITTTMMKLSPRSSFQEVWSVKLDNPSVEGDSGSWVVDTSSGALYGQIVAGIAAANTVFIIPAYRVVENIEEVLGTKVEIVKS